MTDHCIQCTCCILHILHDACITDKFLIIIVSSGPSVGKQAILSVFFVFLVCIITSAYFKGISNCLCNQLHILYNFYVLLSIKCSIRTIILNKYTLTMCGYLATLELKG